MNQTQSPGTAGNSSYMHGLDLLRVICAGAVIYAHLAAWAALRDQESLLIDAINGALISPLHLADQLGFVGLSAFFLISGIVVTHVTFHESPSQFLMRRAVRLLPALWLAVPFAWLLTAAGTQLELRTPSVSDLLFGMLLVDNAVPDAVHVLGVTWTLTVVVTFYLLAAATLPIIRRFPWLPAVVAASLSSVLISFAHTPTDGPMYQLRMIGTFLPVIFIGQLIMLVRQGRLSPTMGTALGLLHLLLIIRSVVTWTDTGRISYLPRTVAVLVLVVILLTRAKGTISRSKLVKVIAKRTYTIYLLHVPIMFATFHYLTDHIGFNAALVVGLVVLAVFVEVLYRGVERPVDRAYRRWETKRKSAQVAPPDPGHPPAG